ncbi:PH domain-like protein [Hypoxylon fragiforme]|uniref:PH domain-like protein n=1 Tax=Hypoxylon fragiforme TaxID=63214 RepID=UPI0020C67B16|nr:PH domain-like protein [Hypoxylon fragiforme]KAI2609054.1 PH domain-like protein [Hypoxylon fragiforme]
MSQTTPRKQQHRNQQQQPYSRSPHSHAQHAYSNSQSHSDQYHQLRQTHSRNRSQQLRAQAAEQLQLANNSAASDYESDTVRYMASHPPPPPASLATRTNTDLNLKVLRRYRPGITSILSIAANAVVYVFTPPAKWDKSNLEGTLFICAQGGDDDYQESEKGSGAANGCLFVLNRKGLQNLILDLSKVCDFELSNGLLIFKLDADGAVALPMENSESVNPNVLGMWIYAEDEQDRRTSTALIHEMWSKARAARQEREGASADPSSTSTSPSDGAELTLTQRTGRKVSLNELFGRKNGS